MHGQVKAQEEGLDEALLHDDLVEVRQHVVDARQIGHQHFEAKRLGHIDQRNVDCIRSAKKRTFLAFVPASQRAQD